ncbi:hypothetical protein EATG_01736 [Escherichia coli H605]|uniref:Uncharacterized protein n=5 Tax=Enterobacteriaceae TaxID=543 RepID=A7ZR37_ECO24|nr:hypothetical protein EcE24377A_3257 [Escherichia coli O139:H28 str. E24377A]EGI14564.1 conserved hypothetical protein [Escherichia coli M605]EGI19890.1 conserved hypothetical protein [Escherichia coli M718]EGI25666.1 conserved hypothetical protein [Escherichia coli TA206]ESU78229.1 hypothetical protein WRSd3_03029 [Shigella dysenteriae WRSd3]OSK35890.1 hypothetical protein EAJG_02477 [Escherichia coli E267]OSK42967.1 hypothetical protein EAIG_03611 [Escherichia coli B108]OSK53812.1 hypoth
MTAQRKDFATLIRDSAKWNKFHRGGAENVT